MPGLDYPPFVGSLWVDSILAGTAFVCGTSRLLVTCAHCLTKSMRKISWEPLSTGSRIELINWIPLINDVESDIAILGSRTRLLAPSEVPDLPRHPNTTGVEVHFSGISEMEENGTLCHSPDSGAGKLIGLRGPLRVRMQSSQVTPGYSGAPVLHQSPEIGLTIIGMISGRYNSIDLWNRDCVWVTRGDHLRSTVLTAKSVLPGQYPDIDPFSVNDLDEPGVLAALIKYQYGPGIDVPETTRTDRDAG